MLPDGALVAQEALKEFTIPYCAFNGGKDVFVDVGNKALGLRALQVIVRGGDGIAWLVVVLIARRGSACDRGCCLCALRASSVRRRTSASTSAIGLPRQVGWRTG